MLEDLRANSWSLRPCCMVLAYRVAHFCSVWRKKNVLNNLWAAPLLVLYRIITECFFGYEIQAAATIGRRFTIHHGRKLQLFTLYQIRNKRMTWRTLLTLLSVRNGKRLADGIRGR